MGFFSVYKEVFPIEISLRVCIRGTRSDGKLNLIYYKYYNLFQVLFNFKFPTIIFYIFILGSSRLPLYYIYLARAGRKG